MVVMLVNAETRAMPCLLLKVADGGGGAGGSDLVLRRCVQTLFSECYHLEHKF